MKPAKILFIFIASNQFYSSLGDVAQPLKNKSKRVNQFWGPQRPHQRYQQVPGAGVLPYHSRRRGSEDEMPMSMPASAPAAEDNDKPKKLQLPQINFYNSVPNSIGVIGQGYLWLREVANAVGTPLPMWIGAIPLLLVGVGLMFFPDLTQLNLPLFYPSGAPGDPLAAFPPIPEVTIPDVQLPSFIEQATKFLPPKLVAMRKG